MNVFDFKRNIIDNKKSLQLRLDDVKILRKITFKLSHVIIIKEHG